ncbi:hypothetical protein AB0C20_35545, partial [Micromonospora sp. NPDC048843]
VTVGGVSVARAQLADYDRVCGFRLTDRLPATSAAALTAAGVDPGARGESLTVEQFAAIAASAPVGTPAGK